MRTIFEKLLLLVLIAPAACMAEAPSDPAQPATPTVSSAVFAGGCFWCMQPPYDELPGVVSTQVGYTGGRLDNPTYEQVSHSETGHYEAIEVRYDPSKLSYDNLLEVFWRNVDPTDDGGQFCDRGNSYKTAIFAADAEQRRLAEASKAALENAGRPAKKLVTPILDALRFWPAEDYHQDYYRKNPLRYKFYRYGCGRDARLKELWGDPAAGH